MAEDLTRRAINAQPLAAEYHSIAQGRLEYRARQPLPIYLSLHGEVDILLDSHPGSGHTTACHALWMGVPVVTMTGQTHASRMVGSVLSTLGLAEWIAKTPEEYIQIASNLAGDRARLRYLREALRPRMQASPLLDGRRFAQEVERNYRQMWRARCDVH